MTDKYKEIRPFNDNEVEEAIKRLIHDDEFTDAIIKYRFPRLSNSFGWLLKPIICRFLQKKWSKVQTVRDVQLAVAAYMDNMIKTSTDGVSYSGIDNLDPNQSYVFISNHRDIAMDPAFVNWGLHTSGRDTLRIAIGDNLLKKPCATELMKLNKSFIVNRSATAPREMLKALTQLSGYIKSSLDEHQSIWIAQREGRAKDGDDKTEPAILKMLFVNGKREKIPFSEYMQSLNIVPVSISYEDDPCDIAKAQELYQKSQTGSYDKSEFEDIESIISGITGYKGKVHVSFGDAIKDEFETPEDLALEIDRQITNNYQLYANNFIAAKVESDIVTDSKRVAFNNKLAALEPGVAEIVRKMYAYPVLKQQDNN
ncbi:1-acyl-sn-glycerol-3-phosphate acyltransferase [Vibrio sp. SS-MA-C1-2]|uniref:1-acyl-sn-glycerol-3-phosphate acyltransferase n=1 Tax=Vibrio sp. SS-MA-C1-2 TaxID=2908646 RepID=UPI001F1C2B93|nr:1-acyl-sn-glycerol-3-phosphate acyltransferase [Vibrio sp. SS-MA-C1-2]UJF17309.1 1-acyl-sn-glycerol-3-phosphate acyltransferase [Vibrio sp. SS-MA-C1-2]